MSNEQKTVLYSSSISDCVEWKFRNVFNDEIVWKRFGVCNRIIRVSIIQTIGEQIEIFI